MKEAFVVGASLNIEGNATKALSRIAAKLADTDKLLKFLKADFTELDDILIGTALSFGKLTNAMTLATSPMRSLNRIFSTFNNRLNASAYRMDTVIGKAAEMKAAMAGVGETVGAANAAMPGVGGRGHGGSKRHGGGHFHVHGFNAGFLGFSPGTLAGGVALWGGYEGYKEQKEYLQEYAQFQQMNFTAAQNAQANHIASISNLPGVSQVNYMSALNDAATVTRNFKQALAVAPVLATANFANNSLYPGKWSAAQSAALVKYGEIRSRDSTPEEIIKNMNVAQRIISGTGGRVKASDLVAFMRTSKAPGKLLSDQAIEELEPVIQERGGHNVGVSIATLFGQLIGGHMTTTDSNRLEKLGVIKPGAIQYDIFGRKLKNKRFILNDTSLYETHPFEWFNEVYLPDLKKAGITSQQAVLSEIGFDFNRNAGSLLSDFYLQATKIDKSGPMNANAKDIEQTALAALNTPQGHEELFMTAAARLGKAIGSLIMPDVLKGMDALTGLLNLLSKLLQKIGSSSIMSKLWHDTVVVPLESSVQGRALKYLANYSNPSPTSKTAVPTPAQLNHANTQKSSLAGDVYFDAQKVGKFLARELGNFMARGQQTGPSGFNGNVTQRYASQSGGWNGG